MVGMWFGRVARLAQRAGQAAWRCSAATGTVYETNMFKLVPARGLHVASGAVTPGMRGLARAAGSRALQDKASFARGLLRRSLFIQCQSTPNPASLMFMAGRPVMEASTATFSSGREAMASPLAKLLFQIDGVTQVFFGADFVTVTKSDAYEWPHLKADVYAAMTEFFSSEQPLFYDARATGNAAHLIHEDDDEVVAMIKELLETRIRPTVQGDGGDIEFRSFDPETGVVVLKMLGSCSGCPSSAQTLKGGIENMLMHYIPEVRSVVEAEPDESESEGIKAFNKLEQHLST